MWTPVGTSVAPGGCVTLLFFGGHGHCAARLAPARALGLEITDVEYPGFEGRPRAATYEDFLESIVEQTNEPGLVYATGVGGLVALSLRARGALMQPIILQGTVGWGSRWRWSQKSMRIPGMAGIARRLLLMRPFQRRFCRRHLSHLRQPPPEGFFEGYRDCASACDLFRWLTPALLRDLETRLAGARIQRISAWWGGRDRVAGLMDLQRTQLALKSGWRLRLFPSWGHYPMIDQPQDWVRKLHDAMT